MGEKVLFNYRLFSIQILFVILLLIFTLGIKDFILNGNSRIKSKALKVNINEADINELVKVPYIGKKTAKKIISYRNSVGKINNLEELKKFRYYKKFKYFLRVE